MLQKKVKASCANQEQHSIPIINGNNVPLLNLIAKKPSIDNENGKIFKKHAYSAAIIKILSCINYAVDSSS